MELFHTLLELPLLAFAMEQEELSESQHVSNETRAINHYLLRNESGVTINFWESDTTLPLLKQFCKNSVVTARVRAAADMVPELLNLYFDVLISYGNERCLSE